MTKKLAELSGSVSVISASLILVLAILVSSIPLPTLPIFSQNAMFSEESISDKANFADEGTKTTPIPAPEELNTNPSVVFSVSQGSFANQMVGKDFWGTLNKANFDRMKGVLLALKDFKEILGPREGINQYFRDCNKILNHKAAINMFDFLSYEEIKKLTYDTLVKVREESKKE